MTTPGKKVRALGLCSGGLDSMLAGVILRRQGIDVHWITFETPFFSSDKARRASALTGIPITVEPITERYMEMLRNPACGYGKNMNPCMDCHALMFRLAGHYMTKNNFDFLFSGEVLAQRPMSQTRSSLRYVEKHSGFDGYILRPLSAKNLPETIPEKQGWVDREQLLDISGRSRKKQIQLAQDFGITDYPSAAGGCLLTDQGYALRLRDLLAHQSAVTESGLHLLKYGRHFRMDGETKIIVGRTQPENLAICRLADLQKDIVLKVLEHPGPTTLLQGPPTPQAVSLAAGLCASYSKAKKGETVTVRVETPEGTMRESTPVQPPAFFQSMMIRRESGRGA